jgi:hypothetical protein
MTRAPFAAALRMAARANLFVCPREYRYVFILAQRRSGSSLLAHILTSHPNFVGAGETHTTYKTAADLPKLIPRTCQLLRKLKLDGAYIVDKITMDQYLRQDEILLSPLIHKCVILIRAPEGSLKSLISHYGFWERTALGIYTSRLETLVRYGSYLRERALLMEYDGLVDNTVETLAALTRFFGVEQPFKPNYITHKATGKIGDPSANIFSGRIIRTLGHEIKISKDVLTEASHSFRSCKHQLLMSGIQSASTIDRI